MSNRVVAALVVFGVAVCLLSWWRGGDRAGAAALADPAPATVAAVMPYTTNHTVVTADSVTRNIEIIDGDSKQVRTTIGLPSTATTVVDIAQDGIAGIAYVVAHGGDVHEVDVTTDTMTSIRSSDNSAIISACADDRALYLLSSNASLIRIDLDTRVETSTPIGALPVDVAVSKDLSLLAVSHSDEANRSGSVDFYSLPGLTLTSSVALDDGAGDVAFASARLFVAMNESRGKYSVEVIDPVGGGSGIAAVTNTIGAAWGGLRLDASNNVLQVYSANDDRLTTYYLGDPDQPEFYGEVTCATNFGGSNSGPRPSLRPGPGPDGKKGGAFCCYCTGITPLPSGGSGGSGGSGSGDGDDDDDDSVPGGSHAATAVVAALLEALELSHEIPTNGEVDTFELTDASTQSSGPSPSLDYKNANTVVGGMGCDGIDPVDMYYGTFELHRQFFALDDVGSAFDIGFTYSTGSDYDGPMGKRVLPSFIDKLERRGDDIHVFTGDFKEQVYTYDGSLGLWTTGVAGSATIRMQANADGDKEFVKTDPRTKEQRFYSHDGWIRRIEDLHGNAKTFEYACGRLSRVRCMLGHRWVKFSYDTSGRITSVRDHANRSWSFGYDDQGRLTGFTRADGSSETFVYEPGTTLIKEIRDSDDHVIVSNVYSGHRVVEQTHNGFPSTVVYGIAPNGDPMTTLTDFDGNVKQFKFDPTTGSLYEESVLTRGLRTNEPTAWTTQYFFNADGRPTKTITPSGQVIEEDWDADGNLHKRRVKVDETATEFLEETWTYVRSSDLDPSDDRGYFFVSTYTDQVGRETTFHYTPGGNLERIRYPDLTAPQVQPVEEKYGWNAFGQVVWSEDGEGRRTEYDYWSADYALHGDKAGNLRTTRRFPDGPGQPSTAEETNFVYDSLGRLISETMPWGDVTTYHWNAMGDLVRRVGPTGVSTRYEYDSNARLAKVRMENKRLDGSNVDDNAEIETILIRDLAGQVIERRLEVANGVFEVWKYDYSGQGEVVRVTDPSGNVEVTDLDERGLLWRVRRGVGTPQEISSTVDYDGDERPVRFVTPRGHVGEVEYDGYGRMERTKHPNGHERRFSYHATGQPSVVEDWDTSGSADASDDELLGRELRTFDAHDRLRTRSVLDRVDQGADIYSTWETTWDRSGKILESRGPDGARVKYETDGLARYVKVIDDLDNRAEYVFENGRLARTDTFDRVGAADVLRTRQELDYDAAGFVAAIRQKNVAGTQTPDIGRTVERDVFGGVLRAVDANGAPTEFDYDGRGRVIRVRKSRQGALYLAEERVYVNGRLQSVTDPANESVFYVYDELDRVKQIDYANGFSEVFGYDADGNMTSFTDRNGTEHALIYDVMGRLLQRAVNPAAGVLGATNVSYAYDVLGRPTSGTSNVGSGHTVDFEWDHGGNLRTETFDGLGVGHEYDLRGRRTSRTSPSGKVVVYGFDTISRLRSVADGTSQSPLYDVDYTGSAVLTSGSFGNGVTMSFQQDEFLRLTELRYDDPSGTTIAGRRFEYDPKGNLKWLEYLPQNLFDVISVDQTDQVRHIVRKANASSVPTVAEGTLSFNLDLLGNRITESWTPWNGAPQTTTYMRGVESRYDGVGDVQYVYDQNGNLVDDGEKLYAYDYANRLVEVRAKTTNALEATFEYGPFGRRLAKTIHGPTVESHRFVYDGVDLMETFDAAGNFVAHYVHASDRYDRPVAIDTSAGRFFCHGDHLGSVDTITNAAGVVVERYDYSPFGETIIRDTQGNVLAKSAVGNPFGYTGQVYDAEIGLYHYKARAYDPTTGRFLQLDPAGFIDGPNRYQYAGGNPLVHTDPTGLFVGKLWNKAKSIGKAVLDHPVTQVVGATVSGFVTGGPAGAVMGALGEALAQALESFGDEIAGAISDFLEQLGVDPAIIATILLSLDRLETLLDLIRSLRNPKQLIREIKKRFGRKDKVPDPSPTGGRKTGGQAVRRAATGAKPYGGATTGRGGGSAGANPGRPGGDVSSKKKQQQGGTTPSSHKKIKCFVAGTPVATARGLRQIEDIRVGDRVLTRLNSRDRERRSRSEAGSSSEKESESDSEPIDPDAWREIHLELERSDGTDVQLVLLRPVAWVERRRVEIGNRVETGFEDSAVYRGLALVKAIRRCPPIEVGEGDVVTATLSSVTDEVVSVKLVENDEVVRATPGHRFWSASRCDWVSASKLRHGERLSTHDGEVTIGEVVVRRVRAAVYNLEVSGRHRYLVGAGRMLVHNDCGTQDSDSGSGNYVYRGLAQGEDPTKGLTARDPSAGNSESSHVAGKRESQWISTTKDRETAINKYGENGVVRINLDKVKTKVSDVSDGFGKRGRPSSYAKSDREVLIQGEVPAEAIDCIR